MQRADVVRDVTAVDHGVHRTAEHGDAQRHADRDAEHRERADQPAARRRSLDREHRQRNERGQRREREQHVDPDCRPARAIPRRGPEARATRTPRRPGAGRTAAAATRAGSASARARAAAHPRRLRRRFPRRRVGLGGKAHTPKSDLQTASCASVGQRTSVAQPARSNKRINAAPGSTWCGSAP